MVWGQLERELIDGLWDQTQLPRHLQALIDRERGRQDHLQALIDRERGRQDLLEYHQEGVENRLKHNEVSKNEVSKDNRSK